MAALAGVPDAPAFGVAGWSAVRSSEARLLLRLRQPTGSYASPRATEQWKLEWELAEFEKKF